VVLGRMQTRVVEDIELALDPLQRKHARL
jgi:hypothetical protein